MPLNGVDISNHNHPIDPSAIPGDFVIMRASEGKGMRDEHFPEYDDVVGPTPKLPGAYHFCWVGDAAGVKNTPQQEAANFATTIKDHLRPGFLLVCDWEPRHHAGNTDWAVDFALEVKRLTGRTPILYANQSTLDNGDWTRWRSEIGTNYWLAGGTAQYAQRTDGYTPGPNPRNPRGWGDPLMWQMTEYGYLPGWAGRLDLNIFYGDADDWRALADGTATREPPKEAPVTKPTVPVIRENDPPVILRNSHGEILRKSNGQPREGCICMALTFPLVEREMIRRGLIKRTIDVFQGGYNLGVAASAGTHDWGGVIDVAQGITREQRGVWADFGVMMAPRTPEWGWTSGPHGHGGWFGCVHRTPALARQVRDMMAGRNGLVSNLVTNWVKPARPWQDAFLASAPPLAPATPRAIGEDVPDIHQQAPITINHAGGGWALARPEAFSPYPTPTRYQLTAYVDGSQGTTLKARVVWWRDGWQRGPEVTINPTPGQPTQGQISHTGWTDRPGINVHLDVWADKPDRVMVRSTTLVWPV